LRHSKNDERAGEVRGLAQPREGWATGAEAVAIEGGVSVLALEGEKLREWRHGESVLGFERERQRIARAQELPRNPLISAERSGELFRLRAR
jgi:hypothetical protein